MEWIIIVAIVLYVLNLFYGSGESSLDGAIYKACNHREKIYTRIPWEKAKAIIMKKGFVVNHESTGGASASIVVTFENKEMVVILIPDRISGKTIISQVDDSPDKVAFVKEYCKL